ncbi:hypothetical protein [Dapis sp. BLCC M172]|uniref:hypothetical protein n=1 Tax=Dapis sp. BLCC M172 TaxID=2975281 RepID=UPI003CE959E3
MQINQHFNKFIISAIAPFLLLTSSLKILASITPGATDNNSILLAQLGGVDWRICSQQNPPLVESFYIETANFLANICQKSNGKLIYIGGHKADPKDIIKINVMAEEGTGYVAEDGDITYIVTGATFSIVKNAKTISEEQVIYICSQFSEIKCQQK